MSIRVKLTLYWTVLLAIILAVAAVTVLGLFDRRQWAALDAALAEEADTSAQDIARDLSSARAIVQLLNSERDLGPRRRVRLVAADGAVLIDGGDPGADLPLVRSSLTRVQVLDGHMHVFRYAVAPLRVQEIPAYLEDGVDVSGVRGAIARLRTVLLLTMPALLALCAAGGYWMAGRALAPMSAVTDALESIDPRDLSRRLGARPAMDEIGKLTAVINAMLQRVERASLTERRFAADAAHELRTPLSILRSGLEIALSHDRTQAEDREALQAALDEVVRLCQMAEDLLMMARLDGQLSIKKARIELCNLVSEVIADLQPLAENQGVRLSVDAAPGTTVDGDASYLKRMVLNLVDNAIKFTPAGGRVQLTLEHEPKSAVIRVRDDGPGVKPEEMPLLFERFFRGSSARDTGGSGLGLSLCREIARLHGGAISASNLPGRGSEFMVTLPTTTPA